MSFAGSAATRKAKAAQKEHAELEKAKARRKIERLEHGEPSIDDHLPLIIKAKIDDLPPLIQKLCDEGPDSIRDAQTAVDFLPERIPPNSCFFWPPAILLFPFWIYSLIKWNHNVLIVLLLLFLWLACFCIALRLCLMRMPIYAKGSDGLIKPWPGDYLWGVYLMGGSALLELKRKVPPGEVVLKEEASVFPVSSIISIVYISDSCRTKLTVRSPPGAENETFEHILDRFNEPDKAFTKIKDWFERSTNK